MKDCELTILRNERVADGIYEMLLTRPEGVFPKGAQFVHIELKDGSRILRRPFCICDCDEEGLLVCYALVGAGTRELASYKVGEKVKAALPLGNGWDADAFRSPVLLGGGMGSAVLPLVARLAKKAKPTAYLGFSDKSKIVLQGRMSGLCPTVVCTDNGSAGRKGYVTEILAQDVKSGAIKPDAIFCCGPEIVYKLLAREEAFADIPVFVSLEKRMGCGVGACLVCTCGIKTKDGVKNLRVCADGPVFDLREVVL